MAWEPEKQGRLQKRIQLRARIMARAVGCPDLADDIFQEVQLGYIRKGAVRGQTVNQAVTDAIRRLLGDKKWRGQERFKQVPLTERLHPQVEQDLSGLLSDEILRDLASEDRALLILYAQWEMTLVEIGHIFGVSDRWASIRLTEIRERLKGKE